MIFKGHFQPELFYDSMNVIYIKCKECVIKEQIIN